MTLLLGEPKVKSFMQQMIGSLVQLAKAIVAGFRRRSVVFFYQFRCIICRNGTQAASYHACWVVNERSVIAMTPCGVTVFNSRVN